MSSFPSMTDLPRSSSPPHSPSRLDNCCTRTERCCCALATWVPIFIVYSATFWAICVNAYIISISFIAGFLGWMLAFLALTLYGLCIWSYSIAVFTDPGSPIDADKGYSYLPTWQPSFDPALHSNITVKNDGRARYCQKCNYMKPDRTHHCSICRRCILKMDHHCPWLGNCIGFRNYKAFLLFLVYLSLFCLECCVLSASSLYYWISYVSPNADYLPVQWILLAVISGIVTLCVGGFSTWHIIHVCQNVTTIEALEKTRYVHTFPSSSSRRPTRRSSNDQINVFNVGMRQNWEQVMGTDPWKWFLPICNSLGNGIAFPVNEDVRRILRGMRSDLSRMEGNGTVFDEEEERVYRRDQNGNWMMHD